MIHDYLTLKEVAEELKVTVQTVQRWVRAGQIAAVSLGRAGYRVERADLEKFIEERILPAQPSE